MYKGVTHFLGELIIEFRRGKRECIQKKERIFLLIYLIYRLLEILKSLIMAVFFLFFSFKMLLLFKSYICTQ